MAAAATKLLMNATTMGPEMMPVLEKKSMGQETLIGKEERRVARIEKKIEAGKERLEELLRGRMNLGSPRSYLRGVGSNAVFMEMLKFYRKRIRILEVDRDRAIKAHDRVKAHNEDVRRKINVLRKNAMLQHKQFDEQRKKLLEVRDKMAADLQNANDIMNLNDECKESIELLKEDDAAEQEDFERECAALSAYVSERLDRLAFIEKGEDITDLAKLTPEEAAAMEKQTAKLQKAMALAAEKDAASTAKLHEYQAAFNKLKQVTGINDIRKMVSSFIDVEERNFGMFRYIQMVNKDAKRSQAALDRVNKEVAAFRESNAEAIAAKRAALERQQREAQRLLNDNEAYQGRYRALGHELESVRKAVRRTFMAVGCAELAEPALPTGRPATGNQRGRQLRNPPASPIQGRRPGTVPPRLGSSGGEVRASAHEVAELLREPVNEGNIMKFVAVIEQRVADVCNATRRRLLAEAAKEEELRAAAAAAEGDEDGAHSAKHSGSVGDARETFERTGKLPAVVNQVNGPPTPAKNHQFHIVLPEIGDDDDDGGVDLAASLSNPITNAMEASMSRLGLGIDGVAAGGDVVGAEDGVALAALLSADRHAASSRGGSRGSPSKRRRSRDSGGGNGNGAGGAVHVQLLSIKQLAEEIAKQFDGPDGLAVSQFIKAGASQRPQERKGGHGRMGQLRRKKRGNTSSAASLRFSQTAPVKASRGMRRSKTTTAVGSRKTRGGRSSGSTGGGAGQVRFSSTMR